MADVITRFKVDLSQYDSNIKKAKSSISGFSKQASADFSRMGASIQSALGPLAAITAAVAGARKVFGDMVSMNRDFEQANANLAAVLGTSRENITALTEDAKRLGASTMFTASQVTQLQTELAKLGFTQGEIKASTKDVLNLAAATGTDLATAAAQAGATLRGFGLNASEMDRVASVLAVSTSKSALSMEKLGVALPVVQTTAAKTGFTLEDTTAMLGKLTDNGINAASAGTQLRKILNDASTAGTKLATYLGGPVHSLDELAAALNKASKEGMTHADSVSLVNSKNATALDILRDMSTATDGETSAVVQLRDALNGCGKELQGMVDEQMNTLEGSTKQLSSAWEGLMLSFSSSNGVLKSLTDGLTGVIQKMTQMSNLRNGGESAVNAFAKGGSKDLAEQYKSENANLGEDGIKAKAEEEIKALDEEEKKVEELFARFKELQKDVSKSSERRAVREQIEAMVGGPINMTDMNNGKARAQFVASLRDRKETLGMVLSSYEKAAPTAAAGPPSDEDPVKSQVKRLQAQEAAQIASLDRQAMNEADYEDRVYEIKRASLQKQQRLYDSESDQYVDYNTKLSNLDIQHQGSVFRRDKRQEKAEQKYQVQTGASGYSQDNIREMHAEIQKQMGSMQMGSEEFMAAYANSIDLATFQNVLNEAIANGVEISEDTKEGLFEKIFNGEDIPDSVWTDLADQINEQLKNLGIDPIEVDVKTGGVKQASKDAKESVSQFQAAASAVQSLSGAMAQMEDPAAKIAGLIGQAIASIALTFASSLKGTATPWDWIAAAAAGTATMIGTIAAIKQATEYHANGGFAGDMFAPRGTDTVPAMLTPGELVLNRAQQTNLASQLQPATPQVNITGRLSGRDILLAADNTNRSRGGSRGVYSRVR